MGGLFTFKHCHFETASARCGVGDAHFCRRFWTQHHDQQHVGASNVNRSWPWLAPIVADAAGTAAAAPVRADLTQLKDDRKQLKQTLKRVSTSIKNEDTGCTAILDPIFIYTILRFIAIIHQDILQRSNYTRGKLNTNIALQVCI